MSVTVSKELPFQHLVLFKAAKGFFFDVVFKKQLCFWLFFFFLDQAGLFLLQLEVMVFLLMFDLGF